MDTSEVTEAFEQLLKDAKQHGGIEYVFTLVRVDSYKSLPRDEVKAFFRYLQGLKAGFKKGNTKNLKISFNKIISDYETFSLITNLVNVAIGQRFQFRPLPYHFKDDTSEIIAPEKAVHIEVLLKKIKTYEEKNHKLSTLFLDAFSTKTRDLYQKLEILTEDEEKEAYQSLAKIVDILHVFLKRYFRELKIVGSGQKLHPSHHQQARFEVYELLSNEKKELYGFSIHQSNGSTVTYERHEKKSEGINFMFNENGEVQINVGLWDDMQPIWMVGQKPVYEIGIPGRYNVVGEWKPLVYPGNADLIQSRVREICKDEKDQRIEGCLFQIMATCHHTIEFIVKADFEIPHDYLSASMGDLKMQLHKIKMVDNLNSIQSNWCVYDGTAFLSKIDKDYIGQALDTIGIFLNRIAFRTDRRVEWFIKYSMYGSEGGKLNLDNKDFKNLGDYLLGLKSDDVGVIDTAISWYASGKKSTNIFTKFLNYYIAVESLAVLLVNGGMEASKDYGYTKISKQERKRQTEEKIAELHEELYLEDPILFIKRSYSEAITSLRSKTENAIKSVFGEDHELTKDFLKKENGKSMYDLRNDLAHGNYNYVNRDEAHQVRNALPALEEIAYRLIMRLSSEKDKKHKRFIRFSMSMGMGSPRGTLVVNNLNIFPVKDWKIRWEWLD